MFQDGAVFEEILTLVLLVIFLVICVAVPGAIANREDSDKTKKDKEVI